VTAGGPGQLWARMPSLAAGYANDPAATAAAFRDGWFATGDRFTVDASGDWHHQGREADRLPVPGGDVNPADVEEQLLEDGRLADACLVADDAAGALTLHAVSAPGLERDRLAQSVRDVLARELAGSPVRIVWHEALPRTASGKVQRYLLRASAPPQDALDAADSTNPEPAG